MILRMWNDEWQHDEIGTMHLNHELQTERHDSMPQFISWFVGIRKWFAIDTFRQDGNIGDFISINSVQSQTKCD